MEPSYQHLARLTTSVGLFEHARFGEPRPEHGFCLDDVTRGLVIVAREPERTPLVDRLREIYLRFSIAALVPDGRFHNRRSVDGRWVDEPSTDDHWGRAIWALATVSTTTADTGVRRPAMSAVARALAARSPSLRAMSYAALGAADLVHRHPGHVQAMGLLHDARAMLPARSDGRRRTRWPWPEPRLAYANAVIPEAMLAVGSALADDICVRRGLSLLEWLFEQETRGNILSPTPVGGWAPGEPRPGFDQQPIEVVALAEACRRAHQLTADPRWLEGLELCEAWFLGRNDLGLPVYEPSSGGGFDGLHRDRVNENQGAESTLAALATLQLVRRTVAEPAA